MQPIRNLTLFLASIIAAFVSIQSIYVAYFGPWDIAHGLISLLCAAVVIVLITKPTIDPKGQAASGLKALGMAFDWVLIALIVAA